MAQRHSDAVTIVAIVTLGVVVLAAIVSLCIVALNTNRDLKVAESLTGGAVLLIAALGGLIVHRATLSRRDRDDD